MTPEQAAWFAGLFEGEGTLCRARPNGRGSWKMSLRSTDRDIIQRIKDIVGGRMYEDAHRRMALSYATRYGHAIANVKPSWTWNLGRQNEIASVVKLIYPHMGERRKAKMDEFLVYFAQPMQDPTQRVKSFWYEPQFQEQRERRNSGVRERWALKRLKKSSRDWLLVGTGMA